jgi:uncharacterized protein YjbJ (UPF0337 family)
MSSNQFEGTVRNATGKAEEVVGSATGDTYHELRGKARQVAGQAQTKVGDAMDTVRDMAADQPITTLLLAAGIGFIAGMLVARR